MRDVGRWLALVAATLILAGAPVLAAQPSASMNPAAFVVELERLSTLVSSGVPTTIPEVRVPAVWSVENRGQRFDISAGWLEQAVEEGRRDPSTWPARRSTILARLNALKLEAQSLADAGAPLPATVDPSTARASLTRVLARPEFQRMARQSAMSRLRRQVSQWIVRILDRLGIGGFGRRGTADVFAWLAALLALGALSMWLVRVLMQPGSGRRVPLTAARPQSRTALAWARDALAAADPRQAARLAYRATVVRLEEEGAWRADDTRTPREYLRLLPGDHRRHGLVTDVTQRFEEIWYGAREATEEDRRSLLSRLKELGCLPAE